MRAQTIICKGFVDLRHQHALKRNLPPNQPSHEILRHKITCYGSRAAMARVPQQEIFIIILRAKEEIRKRFLHQQLTVPRDSNFALSPSEQRIESKILLKILPIGLAESAITSCKSSLPGFGFNIRFYGCVYFGFTNWLRSSHLLRTIGLSIPLIRRPDCGFSGGKSAIRSSHKFHRLTFVGATELCSPISSVLRNLLTAQSCVHSSLPLEEWRQDPHHYGIP